MAPEVHLNTRVCEKRFEDLFTRYFMTILIRFAFWKTLASPKNLTPIENIFLEFSILYEFSPPSRDLLLSHSRPSNVPPSDISPFSRGFSPLHPTISFRSLPRTFTRSTTVPQPYHSYCRVSRDRAICIRRPLVKRLTGAVSLWCSQSTFLFHAFVPPSQTRPHIVLRIPFLNFLGSPSVQR